MSDRDMLHTSAEDQTSADIMQIVEVLREASRPFLSPNDGLMAMSKIMAAAATFSGAVFGGLTAVGAADDEDLRRVTDAMVENFQSGVEIGKRQGAHIAADRFAGRA